ncbi:MAG: hypothetical protein M3290_03585, partial [Actinomycetota bacterium]|nr:hypothetical protein [Actinomycetota bacterium]
MTAVTTGSARRGRIVDAVLRARLPIIAVVAAAHGLWDASTSPSAADGVLFARAGARLLSSSWSHALAA